MAMAGLALLTGGGALIGFLLALLGAGGSILLLPLLVSAAALPTKEAVPLSLLVVMLLALGNLGPYLRRRQFAPRPALILGLPALAGSWIGGSWVKAGSVPEPVQLGVFAVAASTAAWLLTGRRTGSVPDAPSAGRSKQGVRQDLLLAGEGVLVGLLTGIAGVGGGFAIVPALVLLAGLPMQLASGTSLLLIAGNALVALAALGHWPAASLPLLQGFAALLLGSALLSGAEAVRRHQAALLNPATGSAVDAPLHDCTGRGQRAGSSPRAC
jgi:uncharacterized membrane protein YfcA